MKQAIFEDLLPGISKPERILTSETLVDLDHAARLRTDGPENFMGFSISMNPVPVMQRWRKLIRRTATDEETFARLQKAVGRPA